MHTQVVNIGASAFNMPAGPFKAYITEPSKITSTQNANQLFGVDPIVSAPHGVRGTPTRSPSSATLLDVWLSVRVPSPARSAWHAASCPPPSARTPPPSSTELG